MDTPTVEAVEQPKKSWSLLASEAFGSNYYGEVTQPETAPIESAEQELATTFEEDAGEGHGEVEGSAQEAQESAEESPISSFDELTKHYEFDPAWVDTLEVDVKINGEPGKAKLSDLKANYQIREAAEARLKEAKEKARAETQIIAERRDQLNGQYAVVAGLIDKVEKSLTKDEVAINWDQLRNQDPAEWSAKREEFKQRKEEINRLKQDAVGSYQNTIAASEHENRERQQQYLQEQAQQLVEKLPEWKDPSTAKTEKTAVAEYLMNQGFTHDDISTASDHRMIILARKAMLYDKGSDKAAVTQKKVIKIPMVLKPGSPKPQEQISREQRDQAKSRLRKTGSLEDALALMRSGRKG
jgi:hypothetical protein